MSNVTPEMKDKTSSNKENLIISRHQLTIDEYKRSSEEDGDGETEYKAHPAGEAASALFTPDPPRRLTTGKSAHHPHRSSIREIHDILPSSSQSFSNDVGPNRGESEESEADGLSRSDSLVGGASSLASNEKHVFILSEAGKPIYSRHGSEEDYLTLMGIMQALVSVVQIRDDTLESIQYGPWKIVFVRQSPLILVACSSARDSSVAQLRQTLYFLHNQVLSTLTRTQLNRIFENKKNFDLRRLLSGTEKTLSALLDTAWTDPSHLLCAVRCLPVAAGTRDGLGQALLATAGKVKNVVFAILLGGDQLVTMVRLRKYTLHPSDLHLLINLIQSNPSFRNAESWSPICLPRFDDTGFLHTHISYVEEGEECAVCLLLLTVDRNAFFALSEARTRFLEKVNKHKLLSPVSAACSAKQGIPLSDVAIPDLLHFLYKNRGSSQLCCSTFERPYISEPERLRLIENYLQLIDKIHNIDYFDQPLRIMYTTGEKEAILGWVTSNFELYTAFSPTVSKQVAVAKVDKLMKWLKKEEERLFILNPLVF